jgi:hypothetical protein
VLVSPPLGATLRSITTSGTTASLTLSCQGAPGQNCGGTVTLTSNVTTQAKRPIAVSATARARASKPTPKPTRQPTPKRKRKRKRKPKPKPKPAPKITTTESVAGGSYSVAAGGQVTVTIGLNATGRRLLDDLYRVPALAVIGGTSVITSAATFSYGRIRISPAYTWAFTRRSSVAEELSLTGLPAAARVALLCHGGGCPFARRTFAPTNGKLKLASALKHGHLRPRATVEVQITAPADVGEVVVFTIRSNKPPTESFRCLPPGARRPAACV